MRAKLTLISFAALLALSACGEKKTANEGVDNRLEIEIKAEREKLEAANLAASNAFLKGNADKDGVLVTPTGLQYMVLSEGPEDGLTPVSTDIVVAHFTGTFKDGIEFDSSHARGAAAAFPLNGVIPGWTEGIQLMSEGDKFRFFIPSELGYGVQGYPGSPIGSNEALIFDIELLKVHNPERNLAQATSFLGDNGKKEGVMTTASGLQYEVITKGPEDGATPKATNRVKVHYKGTFLNEDEFDSSIARGEPSEFPLNRVIKGWTEGVQLMHPGDKYRFFIHPDIAYGASGKPPSIGPNEALIFEIELLEVK